MELDSAADLYQEEHGIDKLIGMLSSEYKSNAVAQHHTELAAIPWLRVYTTNYDDVYELASKKNNRDVQSLTPQISPEDAVFSANDCIHINGFIHDLTKSTLRTSFKLTRTSYLTDTFADNPWSDLFATDLKVAKAVIFVGYSLYDLDLARFLYSTLSLREKTFFVVSSSPSKLEIRNLDNFGKVHTIGVDGLAARIKSRRSTYIPKLIDAPVFTCFDHTFIPAAPRPIKDSDVFALLMYGSIDINLLWQSVNKKDGHTYSIQRLALDEITKAIIDHEKNIVIHSDLGNGKSIIVEQIRCWANGNNRNIFVLRESHRRVIEEVRAICKFSDPIIVIETYETRMSLLSELARQRPDRSTVIVTSRSSVHDLRFRALRDAIGDFHEIDVNSLAGQDIEQLSALLTQYGMWGDYANLNEKAKRLFIETECGGQIYAVLLKLLEAPSMRQRFTAELASLASYEDIYEIIISIFILQCLSIQTNGQLLLDLLGPDVQMRLREFQKEVGAFINSRNGDIRARSSVLAEFVLRQLADGGVVLDAMIRIANAAARKVGSIYRSAVYRDILVAIVRLTNVQAILPDKGKRQAIIELYESLKNIPFNQTHPHFWLQYAVARVTLNEYPEAAQYFKTAYSLAKGMAGYDTSYIDNHYARYLLARITFAPTWSEPNEVFREAWEIVKNQSRVENRHYPYRVAALFSDFYQQFKTVLSADDRQFVLDACKEMLDSIPNLPDRIRRHYSVRACLRKLSDLLKKE